MAKRINGPSRLAPSGQPGNEDSSFSQFCRLLKFISEAVGITFPGKILY